MTGRIVTVLQVPPPGSTTVSEPRKAVTKITVGKQGPPGAPGTSPPRFTFVQSVANATWTVNHNLGYKPHVSVLSVGGLEMLAEVLHASDNQVLVLFDSPKLGSVLCL